MVDQVHEECWQIRDEDDAANVSPKMHGVDQSNMSMNSLSISHRPFQVVLAKGGFQLNSR